MSELISLQNWLLDNIPEEKVKCHFCKRRANIELIYYFPYSKGKEIRRANLCDSHLIGLYMLFGMELPNLIIEYNNLIKGSEWSG